MHALNVCKAILVFEGIWLNSRARECERSPWCRGFPPFAATASSSSTGGHGTPGEAVPCLECGWAIRHQVGGRCLPCHRLWQIQLLLSAHRLSTFERAALEDTFDGVLRLLAVIVARGGDQPPSSGRRGA